MTDEKLRGYFEFFNDLWKFFKKHHDNKTDGDWNRSILDADKLYKKHQEISEDFIRKVVVELMNEIERVNKEES